MLIVAANASAKWGGEAVIPIHIFRGLRTLGHETWLCVGEETRKELDDVLGPDRNRVRYVADGARHALFRQLEAHTPRVFGMHPFYFLGVSLTQFQLCRMARKLVQELKIDIVHQPTPVSPKAPSFLTDLGAPLVVGPMNGGMEYPSGFQFLESGIQRTMRRFGRAASASMNAVFRGKEEAACLLVANRRSLGALPPNVDRDKVQMLPENAIDPELWRAPPKSTRPARPCELRLVFIGRLVPWKGAELLIEAMARALRQVECQLTVVGDFREERQRLTSRASALGIASRVQFVGWLPQARCAELLAQSDVLVLPSVFECGGAVVLEAMACGKPVIAVDWGGPADYLSKDCAFLIPPASPEGVVEGTVQAIVALARDAGLRRRMGSAGRDRVLAQFTWPARLQELLKVYRDVLG